MVFPNGAELFFFFFCVFIFVTPREPRILWMLAIVQLQQLLQTETRCHVAYVILDTIGPAAVLATTVVNVEKKKWIYFKFLSAGVNDLQRIWKASCWIEHWMRDYYCRFLYQGTVLITVVPFMLVGPLNVYKLIHRPACRAVEKNKERRIRQVLDYSWMTVTATLPP